MMTFEQWLTLDKRIPEKEWTYRQYGNYLEGWRNSLPWAWVGMSEKYDRWAEGKWPLMPIKEKLIQAWKWGLAISIRPEIEWARIASVEECADYMLEMFL